MTTTPSLTTALTNALPVLNALMFEALKRHYYETAKHANLAIDFIHEYPAEIACKKGADSSVVKTWFREGQPVIEELKKFL